MLQLRPCDGIGAFAKEFHVPIGTSIAGVRFAAGGPGTVFPEIALVHGPVTAEPAAPVRSVRDVREAAEPGRVSVLWGEPVVSVEDVYHVIVRLPRQPDAGRAPRVGAVEAPAPAGSYIVSLAGEAPIAVAADLDIRLVTSAAGKAGGAAGSDDPRHAHWNGRATLLVLGPRDAAAVATLWLTLPAGCLVEAALHDVRGRLVRTLVPRSFLRNGSHRIEWDGTSSGGHAVAGGVYFVHVTAGNERLTSKLVVR